MMQRQALVPVVLVDVCTVCKLSQLQTNVAACSTGSGQEVAACKLWQTAKLKAGFGHQAELFVHDTLQEHNTRMESALMLLQHH